MNNTAAPEEVMHISQWSIAHRQQAAIILNLAFAHAQTDWADLGECRREVATFQDNPAMTALGIIGDDLLYGWIGAIRQSKYAWELHPLAVHPDRQSQGVGARLVAALVEKAAAENISTLWLLTDDDFGGTNLYGADLYPDVLSKLRSIKAVGRHPYTFYLKNGFEITGAIPDATGFGRPDILMARRISGGK